jgi:hypothetical protein
VAEQLKKVTELAKQTEEARLSFEQGTEFVFSGGDAESDLQAELIVDDELSETSENPLKNRAVAAAIKDVLLLAHPVGSLYFSFNATSPATLFGGVWERIKDKFILAAGDKYPAGSTGGAETVKLESANMPSHTHEIIKNFGTFPIDTTKQPEWAIKLQDGTVSNVKENPATGAVGGIGYTGGNTPHNNMPPYQACYCWKRTA